MQYPQLGVAQRRDLKNAERECGKRDAYRIAGRAGVHTIVDVGACAGAFSRAARGLYPAARIWAFEPSPLNFPLLRQSVTGLGIQCIQAAMADCEGLAKFNVGVLPTCSALAGQCYPNRGICDEAEVWCTTLAEVLTAAGPVSILKLDVEGAEAEILENTSAADLGLVTYITGEWHDKDRRDRVEIALSATHTVELVSIKPQRGYFYAELK